MGVNFFKKTNLFLGIVILLAILLRFYRLGDIPVGFHRDEAFLGYNAYSILNTGKDMSGHFLPVHLESFLYSPAGYSYLSLPFIKLFGLSPFSVRFASAFFGTLTILVTYFLVLELFKKRDLALFSSLFLSISPWHINLSRTATENIVVLFFVTLGTLLYILWLKSKRWWLLILAFIAFGITILVYQAPRAFLPFFIPAVMLLYGEKNIRKKTWLLPIVLFVISIVIPLFIILSSKELSLRIRTVSLFATEETQLVIDEQIREDGVSNIPPVLARGFHNKILGYSGQFLENYFKHFSFEFFFTDKSLPVRYHVPLVGLLYVFELPLLILGTFYLLRHTDKKVTMLLILWIFLVPIGSALTFDDIPNLQRTLLVLPCLSILSANGFMQLISFFSKKPLFSIAFPVGITIVMVCNIVVYFHLYYVHAKLYRPWYRHDGYKKLVDTVNQQLPYYTKAIITDRESAPTIFFLFYGTYDPAMFQRETKDSTMRDFDRINFGKYIFSQEECPAKEKESIQKGVLYVNSGFCKDVADVKEYKEIKRKDNSVVFRIYVGQ